MSKKYLKIVLSWLVHEAREQVRLLETAEDYDDIEKIGDLIFAITSLYEELRKRHVLGSHFDKQVLDYIGNTLEGYRTMYVFKTFTTPYKKRDPEGVMTLADFMRGID